MKKLNIDISEYVLERPSSIKIQKDEKIMYDIEVEDNTFFIYLDEHTTMLTHNCDGIGHIASLLINLFYKWFKFIIEHNKLFILITPLISVDVNKDRKYFYSSKEFSEYTNSTTDKYSNVRYLKGLGSLSVKDWDYIMKKRDCYRIYADRSAKKFLWMGFDSKSIYRKRWLEGII